MRNTCVALGPDFMQVGYGCRLVLIYAIIFLSTERAFGGVFVSSSAHRLIEHPRRRKSQLCMN